MLIIKRRDPLVFSILGLRVSDDGMYVAETIKSGSAADGQGLRPGMALMSVGAAWNPTPPRSPLSMVTFSFSFHAGCDIVTDASPYSQAQNLPRDSRVLASHTTCATSDPVS